MKRAAAVLLLVLSGAAQAAGPHSLAVRASVLGSCKFSMPGSVVSLALDPTSTAAVSQTTAVTYRCTKGNSTTFTLASVNGNRLLRGAEAIPYAYASAQNNNGNGNGNAFGQDKVLSVTVTVSQAAAANVTPGIYTDVMNVTLTP
jgi:spore coat protein U-like protein